MEESKKEKKEENKKVKVGSAEESLRMGLGSWSLDGLTHSSCP